MDFSKLRRFPEDIQKGDILQAPDFQKEFIVIKTPKETGDMSCQAKDTKDGKKYWVFLRAGMLINGVLVK